ncbi:MAG: hypothetical protein ABI230_00725 [Aestuariivirga sp.]
MTISESIAAALALIATVLALEGVTRGGNKQLLVGLLFGLAAALTFSFGDGLSTLNLQMIDQLPRWRDVAHPLPEAALPPAPKPEVKQQVTDAAPPPTPPKTEATPPKVQTTASNDTSAKSKAPVINFHPTFSPNGLPRFLAIYPRKKFMDKTDWNAPPLKALNAMYDALTVHDWEKANAYAEAALSQLKVADIENKDYYLFHITWVQGIAKMEMGNFGQAILYFNDASKMSAYGNTGADDTLRFQIDIEIAYLFADAPNARYMRDFLPDLESASQTHLQEITLLHYARALRAAKDADAATSNQELEVAKNLAWKMMLANERDAATRLTTIFSEPFGAPPQMAVAAQVAVQTAPASLPAKQETSIKQVTASPHFYPVYPREVFMSAVDWKNPAVPALVPLYDALEKGDWQGAIDLNYDAIRQADILPNKKYRYYRGHILWLSAIAKLESGAPAQALESLEQARKEMLDEFVGLDEQKRMRIDIVLFSTLANGTNSSPGEDVLTTLENTPGSTWHELALMHYAHALRAKNAGDFNNVVTQLALANKMITEIDLRGGHDQVIRLRSVLAAQFPQ